MNKQTRDPLFVVAGARVYIDGLVQERRNSIAKALDLHLSCTNPSILAVNKQTPSHFYTVTHGK